MDSPASLIISQSGTFTLMHVYAMKNFYGNWKLEMFLPVSPIAAVEVSQNQLGIQPLTEKNFQFYRAIFFLGKYI